MTMTLDADRRAYKWARIREASVLQERQRLRSVYPLAMVSGELRRLQLVSRIWRTRAASLETSEHLGLPL